jgi:hypothetical protein
VDPFASTSQRGEQLETDGHKSNYGPPPGSAVASGGAVAAGSAVPSGNPVASGSAASDSARNVSPLASSHFVVDVPTQVAAKPKPAQTEEIAEVEPTKISVNVARPPEFASAPEGSRPPEPLLQRFPSSLVPSMPPVRSVQSEPVDAGPMSMPVMSMPQLQRQPPAVARSAPPSVQANPSVRPEQSSAPYPAVQPPAAVQQPAERYSPPVPSPQSAPVLAPGARVWVRWANGQNYPGTVHQIHAGRCLVGFADGQQHWIEFAYLMPG